MAFRINEEIEHGWIDNRIRGKVTGKIYIKGQESPVILDLTGNCHRDMAGSLCKFRNSSPVQNNRLELNLQQIGKTGDMTASRRCRIPDIPVLEYYEQRKKGLNPPSHMSNVLYLEWFSERNGRVVIELPDADIDVSLPEWKMSIEEEQDELRKNQENLTSFLDQIVEAVEQPDTLPAAEEMDEFEWERLLKNSDAIADKYGELLEKYMDHPDCEKIINEQMGWNFEIGSDNTDFFDDSDIDNTDISAVSERREHPLIRRMWNLWLSIHQYAEKNGYQKSQESVALLISDLIFNIQFANAKAGAVLPDRDLYDDGMVIAILKRALTGIHKALDIAGNEEVIEALPNIIGPAREELFAIRQEIVKIMNKLRQG